MPNLLVRNVPAATVAALKRRARQHRRSLQQELAAVLEEAAERAAPPSPDQLAAAIRARLARPGRVFADSAALVREDRAR